MGTEIIGGLPSVAGNFTVLIGQIFLRPAITDIPKHVFHLEELFPSQVGIAIRIILVGGEQCLHAFR